MLINVNKDGTIKGYEPIREYANKHSISYDKLSDAVTEDQGLPVIQIRSGHNRFYFIKSTYDPKNLKKIYPFNVKPQKERMKSRNNDIWSDYKAGQTIEHIAFSYDLSVSRVQDIIRGYEKKKVQ